MTEYPDENVDTEEEMAFDDLTITDNYSYCDILEEEKETITENHNVWDKKQKKCRGKLLLIIYSKKR